MTSLAAGGHWSDSILGRVAEARDRKDFMPWALSRAAAMRQQVQLHGPERFAEQ